MSRSFPSEECKLLVGKESGDVEIGNIQETYQFLLRSAHNPQNKTAPSIRKIPSRIRDLKTKVFEPCQVSIGPLHRKNVNLQEFEGKKEIFLHDLLHHSGLPTEKRLETIVQKVNASIGRIKECYGDGIKGYSDDDITRMLVMDGCFILEFIYKTFTGSFDKNMVIEPISMAFDLMLIENQIPFFILQDIFECISSRFELVTSLHKLIISGFVPALGFFDLNFKIENNEVFSRPHNHILGFIHECYGPRLSELKPNLLGDSEKDGEKDQLSYSKDHQLKLYSAVELDMAGLKFKLHHQRQDKKWAMDMKLELPCFSWYWPWANPTLRMPSLDIHNFTEMVFRNMIAYEQLSPGWVIHYITSYVIAMDLLIDNHEDVASLVKSKVLVNTRGSNEEAAKLINDMRKDIACPHLLYNELWMEMHKYHNRFWPRNIAWLRRTYFTNPWNIIALLAGIFLFVLTVLQTYFTINPSV